MNADRASRNTGFSLIELLVTVALLSILLALGVPAFTDLIVSTKLTSATNTLIGHLQYARAEAIKRGRGLVGVGPYKSDTAWLEDDSWEGGYMVAAADNASPPNLQVLRRVDKTDLASLTITSTNKTEPIVYFEHDGSTHGVANTTLRICSKNDPNKKRGVTISAIGRVRATDQGFKCR